MIISLASMSSDSSAVVGKFVPVNKGVCFKDYNRMMEVMGANAPDQPETTPHVR